MAEELRRGYLPDQKLAPESTEDNITGQLGGVNMKDDNLAFIFPEGTTAAQMQEAQRGIQNILAGRPANQPLKLSFTGNRPFSGGNIAVRILGGKIVCDFLDGFFTEIGRSASAAAWPAIRDWLSHKFGAKPSDDMQSLLSISQVDNSLIRTKLIEQWARSHNR